MDKTDNMDKMENKSNESAQQSAETNKKIEELINRKIGELLQTPYARNLTREKVLHDWKAKEKSLKNSGTIPEKIDEDSINVTYKNLENDYIDTFLRYKKYAIYKTAQKYAVDNYLKNFEDNYLVPGLGIERGQIMQIYGVPGAGKTWLSLEMAYKMAIGGWILNTSEYAVTKPLNVLYIDNENGKTLIKRLIEMELYDMELANKDLYLIQNGGVFTEDGVKEYLPVDRFGKDPNDKNTETLTDAIIGMVMTGSIPKPDVVFLDPLADLMLGDENSTKDMKNFVYDTKRLIENLGSTIIINHHTRKDSKDITEELYGSRGSTVLPGALDMAIELRVKKEGNDKKAGKKAGKKANKKETDKNAEEKTEQQENTESQEDTALQKIVEAKITKPNRNGTQVYPFDYGIFNTVIDELNPHWAETWTGTKFNGVVVSKIYNLAYARARLRAEMIALMHQQSSFLQQPSLKPATISKEEFNEKIRSIIKKYPDAYGDNDKRIDNAYKELKDPKNKDIEKEEETSSDDN